MGIRRMVGAGIAGFVLISSVPSDSSEASAARLHGPGKAAARWFDAQPADGLCGPTAVGMAVSQLTRRAVTAFEARTAATELGLRLRTGDGWGLTRRSGLVRLLERFGIEASEERTTANGLRRFLDQGRAVLVHVDASVLWFGRGADRANHFAVLTGIDDRTGAAILNDPGLGPALGFEPGTGAGYEVPMTVFERAWAESGRHALVTEPVVSGTLRPA